MLLRTHAKKPLLCSLNGSAPSLKQQVNPETTLPPSQSLSLCWLQRGAHVFMKPNFLEASCIMQILVIALSEQYF